jgi:hypothetical protein
MKYVISDLGEVAVNGPFHAEMARKLQGRVIAAGHYRISADGSRVEVFGYSRGLHIRAKPEDAPLIARHLGL